jgi:hypothetical protein
MEEAKLRYYCTSPGWACGPEFGKISANPRQIFGKSSVWISRGLRGSESLMRCEENIHTVFVRKASAKYAQKSRREQR